MTTPSPQCTSRDSSEMARNGKIHNGKQNHKCSDCSRQFVLNPTKKRISG